MRLFLESISPTNHAHRIQRPLFIAQGANDPRVPQSEADQMVQTIRANPEAGEVWYFLARDEGHGFRKKSNRDLYNNAVALFLREHLLPLPPEPEPEPTPDLPSEPEPEPTPELPSEPAAAPTPEATPASELAAPPDTLPAADAEPSPAEQAPLEAPTEDPPIDVLDPLPQPEEP